MPYDPVCKMKVDDTPYYLDVNEKRYFFCSEGCMHLFQNEPDKFVRDYIFDLVIIGGGPAGLTAGVYASIFRLDTLLITQDLGGQAVDSTKIKNYMGFDMITGPQLKEKFQNQLLHKNYIAHRMATVHRVRKENDIFILEVDNGENIRARSLIVATGMSRNRLNVPGEEKFQRRGVCYSVVQDAPLFAGKNVVVVGGGNSATQAAYELSEICRNVVIVSLTPLTADTEEIEKIRGLSNVTVYEQFTVEEIGGKDRVEWVRIRSASDQSVQTIPAEGVFIEIGFKPNSGLVAGLVEINQRGEIKIGKDCSTSQQGIYAAGDVTDAYGKRIIIAAGEGAKAAIAVKEYLKILRKKGRKEIA
jgi:alkyl hydroperoxide reductase subunit F